MNAKSFDINNYSTLPPDTKVTEIKNRKHGLQEFLNRDDKKMSIDIDKLRKHYIDQDSMG